MIAVIQRVRRASVTVGSHISAQIGQGLVMLLGVARGDTGQDVDFMVKKFPDFEFFRTHRAK